MKHIWAMSIGIWAEQLHEATPISQEHMQLSFKAGTASMPHCRHTFLWSECLWKSCSVEMTVKCAAP